MDALKNLIGKKVEVYCTVVDDDFFSFEGNENLDYAIIQGNKCISFNAEVISIEIDDYYFYEKQEQIYITVYVKPIGIVPVGIDECDYETTLEYIRYNGN
jgi:hypothetical protein